MTLAVLAGGAGSRMGKPKGLLEIDGRPILGYLLDRFAWPGPTLLVTGPGRERPPGWEAFGREVVDPVAGEGPLRGVLTALDECATELLVVATVDMPMVARQQAAWMAGQLRLRPGSLGVMCQRTQGIEPFPAALRASAALVIGERLDRRQRSMHALAGAGFDVVPAPATWGVEVWTNLNLPDDLRAWAASGGR